MLDTNFYNDVRALIPIFVLTKVADRHRRQAQGRDHDLVFHRLFVGVAIAAEGVALALASTDHAKEWVDWVLIAAMAFCGAIFAWELLRLDGRELEAFAPGVRPASVGRTGQPCAALASEGRDASESRRIHRIQSA